ncbi:hypothetical protein H9P43_007381 [Blastocladiella emersonii ATCC 22665]|nr:hypothetical protein H9P43_007381 [Blastocladiella emersonii ATCC 22665]
MGRTRNPQSRTTTSEAAAPAAIAAKQEPVPSSSRSKSPKPKHQPAPTPIAAAADALDEAAAATARGRQQSRSSSSTSRPASPGKKNATRVPSPNRGAAPAKQAPPAAEPVRPTKLKEPADIGFESGAWMFDANRAPAWLAAQLNAAGAGGKKAVAVVKQQAAVPAQEKQPVQNSGSRPASPSAKSAPKQQPPAKQSQQQASVSAVKQQSAAAAKPHPAAASTAAQPVRPTKLAEPADIGFDSGAWMFDTTRAPGWLAAQLGAAAVGKKESAKQAAVVAVKSVALPSATATAAGGEDKATAWMRDASVSPGRFAVAPVPRTEAAAAPAPALKQRAGPKTVAEVLAHHAASQKTGSRNTVDVDRSKFGRVPLSAPAHPAGKWAALVAGGGSVGRTSIYETQLPPAATVEAEPVTEHVTAAAVEFTKPSLPGPTRDLPSLDIVRALATLEKLKRRADPNYVSPLPSPVLETSPVRSERARVRTAIEQHTVDAGVQLAASLGMAFLVVFLAVVARFTVVGMPAMRGGGVEQTKLFGGQLEYGSVEFGG